MNPAQQGVLTHVMGPAIQARFANSATHGGLPRVGELVYGHNTRGERIHFEVLAHATDENVRAIALSEAVARAMPRRDVSAVEADHVAHGRPLVPACEAGPSGVFAPDGTVAECGLAYGGMAASTVNARKTEEFLVGKRWTRAVLDAARAELGSRVELQVGVMVEVPALALLAVSIPIALGLGAEFMPRLDEGDLLYKFCN